MVGYGLPGFLFLTKNQLPRSVGAGGAPLHRFAVPLALSGEASLICNLCDITCNKMAPLKGSNCPGDSSIQ